MHTQLFHTNSYSQQLEMKGGGTCPRPARDLCRPVTQSNYCVADRNIGLHTAMNGPAWPPAFSVSAI